jgi:hypothetical protein
VRQEAEIGGWQQAEVWQEAEIEAQQETEVRQGSGIEASQEDETGVWQQAEQAVAWLAQGDFQQVGNEETGSQRWVWEWLE